MTRRVNQFSPRWWKTERIQHNQDLDPVTKYPNSVGGGGSGKGLELWSSTKAYAKNDVVFFNSPDVKGIFVANDAIPASGFLNIGVDGPTWSIVGDEFASIPNWYAMEWPANSVVVRAGAIRRAIGNTSASWVDSEWDNLTPAPVAADTELLFENHDATKSYKKDQAVVVSGKLYRARVNLGALPFSTSDWEEVSPSSSAGLTEVQIFDFDTVDTYKANELCVLNDKLYRAINNTGPGTFVISDWKEVSADSASVTTVADFSTSKTYVTNELTIYSGRLYRATKDVAAGAFSLSNFASADATGIVDAFDPTQSYNKGEIVRHQASFFMAAVNVPAGPFNLATAQWAYIGGGTVTTTDWNNTLFYPFGATVIKDKAVYRSRANQMAGAWVDNLWEPIASLHGRLPAFSGVETYYKDMVVTYNGFAWRCTVVSAAASTMPEGNPNWEKLFSLSLNPNVLPYTANAKYNSGDVVVAEGRLIRANKAIASAPAVFTPADWDALSQLSMAVWNGGKCSFVGDTFVDNGMLWRCKVTNRGAWSDSNFEEIGKIDQLKPYDATKKYRLNQLVTRNGQILRCESDVSAIGYDSDDWEFFGHLESIQVFNAGREYNKLDAVFFNNVIWETYGHIPAGPFNPANWSRIAGTPRINEFAPDFPYLVGDIITVGNKLYINNEGVQRPTIMMSDWTQFGQMRGLWDIAGVYLEEDIVINGNNIYRANGYIAANTPFVQGSGSTEWTRLSPSEPPSAPDFAPLQAYKKDSLVIRGGKLYRSKADFTAAASWDDNDWQALVAEAAASVPDFVLAKDYVLNQVVAQDGVLYRARSVITAAQADKLPAADPTKWQAVSLTYIHVPDHSATGTYALNECVINPADNRMYRAKVAITTGRAFADADWQLIADRVPNVVTWDAVTSANNVWFLGDIVKREDGVFVATKNTPAAGLSVWPAADVRRINNASNFYGAHSDTSHVLPVGAILFDANGNLVEVTATTKAANLGVTNHRILVAAKTVPWSGFVEYANGAQVVYRGVIYRANKATTVGVDPEGSLEWDVVLNASTWFTFWSSSKDYLDGEIVIRSGQLYLATADNAAGTFESGSWQLISGSQAKVKDWNTTQANNTWLVGDFIRRYGNIYVAETESAAGGEATWPNAKLKQLNVEPIFVGTESDALVRRVKIGDVYISNQGHTCRYLVDGDPTTFMGPYYDIINFDMAKLAAWVSDIYPSGYMVTHKNKIWKAVTAATISDEPGATPVVWREVAPSRVVADDFSAGREYVKNELVVNGGSLYRAKNVTSGGFVDAEWEVIATKDILAKATDFSAGSQYEAGQLVVKTGKLYRAKLAVPAKLWDDADWELLTPDAPQVLISVEDFSSGKAYKANELTVYAGKLQRAKQNNGPSPFSQVDWQELGGSGYLTAISIPDFSASKAYVKDELTIFQGRVYRAKAAVAAGAFSASNWEVVKASANVEQFSSAKAYYAGDVVTNSGSSFIALVDQAAGAFDATKWVYIGGTPDQLNVFDVNVLYPQGALIRLNKAIYRAKGTLNPGSFDINNWELVADSYTALRDFAGSTFYNKDELVVNNDFVYRAKADFTASGSFDANNWILIGNARGAVIIRDFVANAPYEKGEVVRVNGRNWVRNATTANAGASFAAADWTPTSNLVLAAFDTGTTYAKGDVVTVSGALYRCKVDSATGSFVAANWTEIGKTNSLVAFDAAANYTKDQIVHRNGQLWGAKADVTAGSWSEAAWNFLGTINGTRMLVSGATYTAGETVFFYGRNWKVKVTHTYTASVDLANFDTNEVLTASAGAYNSQFGAKVGETKLFKQRFWYCVTAQAPGENFDVTKWATLSSVVRGLHVLANDYLEDDIVIKGNHFYRANGVIPTNTAFVEGSGTTEWTRLAPSEPPSAPDFATNQAYKKNSLVIRGGKLYRAKADFTSGAQWDDVNWEALVAEAAASVPDFVANKDYVLNQVVAQGGVLYRARIAIPAANATQTPDLDTTNWMAVSLTYIHVPDHSASGTYAKNECVINPANGRMYRAKAAITTGRAFAMADWTLIADRVPNLFTWDTVTADNNKYFASDIVFKDGQTWVAISDGPAAGTLTWTPGDFKALTKLTVFQGYGPDTTHELPANSIILMPSGALVQVNKAVLYSAITSGDYTVLANNVAKWVPGVVFAPGSLVAHAGAIYSAKVTATADKSPLELPAEWEVVLESACFIRNHDAAVSYFKDAIVVKDLALYRAKADVPAAAWDATKWEQVGQKYPTVREWNTTKASNIWYKGDFVYRFNLICMAKADSDPVGENSWPNSKLATIGYENNFQGHINQLGSKQASVGQLYIDSSNNVVSVVTANSFISLAENEKEIIFQATAPAAYVSTTQYAKGRVVTHEGRVYRANAFVAASKVPGVDSVWTQTSLLRPVVATWVANLDVAILELVIKDGKLYRAKEANTLAVWDDAKYELVGGAGGVSDWNATTAYKANDKVLFGGSVFYAKVDIAKGLGNPDSNFDWIASNRATGIKLLNAGEAVGVGDYREYNKIVLRCKSAHDVSATMNQAELDTWDVMYGNMGGVSYTAKTYIAADSVLDFTNTANWTKSGVIALPDTDNFVYWKNAGARFYLNGLPLASAAASFTEKGFTITGYYVESGDMISVEF